MKCPNCGKEVKEGIKFCGFCGEGIPFKKDYPSRPAQEVPIAENPLRKKSSSPWMITTKIVTSGVEISSLLTLKAIVCANWEDNPTSSSAHLGRGRMD